MLAIVDHSPEQNLATWYFVRYLATAEAQAEWAAAGGFLPANAEAYDLLTENGELDFDPVGLDFAPLAQPDPNLPSWPVVQPAVEDALLVILHAEDQSEVSENLALLAETITELVGEVR